MTLNSMINCAVCFTVLGDRLEGGCHVSSRPANASAQHLTHPQTSPLHSLILVTTPSSSLHFAGQMTVSSHGHKLYASWYRRY